MDRIRAAVNRFYCPLIMCDMFGVIMGESTRAFYHMKTSIHGPSNHRPPSQMTLAANDSTAHPAHLRLSRLFLQITVTITVTLSL